MGLVHYPIKDKAGNIVATNVTNLDVHDIARACKVYGIENYYVINPMKEQLMFVSRILDFWRTGTGSRYNHMRRTALTMVKPAESIGEAIRDLSGEGTPERGPAFTVKVIGTSARAHQIADSLSLELVKFRDLRDRVRAEKAEAVSAGEHYLLLFGTGFGMADEVFQQCHGVLEPLRGEPPQDYRHLSVRSAVSICLDRLLGTW